MEKWTTYGGPHGYTNKKLAKEVATRYSKKSYKGKKFFSKVKVKSKKMPYGEKRYFVSGKWR